VIEDVFCRIIGLLDLCGVIERRTGTINFRSKGNPLVWRNLDGKPNQYSDGLPVVTAPSSKAKRLGEICLFFQTTCLLHAWSMTKLMPTVEDAPFAVGFLHPTGTESAPS